MDLGGVVMAMDAAGAGCGVGSSELGLLGSRLPKHGRGNAEEQGWRAAKIPRGGGGAEAVVSAEAVKAAPFLLGSCSSGHGGEHMLSFSSSASSSPPAAAVDGALPLYYGTPASCSGLSSVGMNTSMHAAMARVRGPFTPSQWMELEHQALIYKYLAANSPIPQSLLIPIRRSLTSPYSPAYFGTSTLGWGSFQLGYSGSADPEPGRCRRTDGKKWRCSRDAVADQKYCERHMNRGRHRSRKHVEGQPGHAAKSMPAAVAAAAAAQPSAPAASGGGSTSGLTVAQQQPAKNYSASSIDPCSLQYNRALVNKQNESEQVQDSNNLSMLTSMNLNNLGSLFPASKQHNPFEVTSSRPDFGLGSSDSLMGSPQNSLENNFLNEHQSSASLQQGSALSWPYLEDMQAQRTQLSISIPMASSDLSSASTSPAHGKLTLSPLKLSREYSPMGLSIAANKDEVSQGEANWMPMFCDSSMGGPLGEVLTKNSNAETRNCLSASLNLLTDGWDSSPRLESSPTGVLQKTAFGSVSSSTGSSPRPENNNTYEGTGNPRDELGSIVVSHPSIRLM